MRKTKRGRASSTPLTSSGVLRMTWSPRASRCLPVRRRISASSDSRPGECATSLKTPQQYEPSTKQLLYPSRQGQRFGNRDVVGPVDVYDGFDDLAVERLPCPAEPGQE